FAGPDDGFHWEPLRWGGTGSGPHDGLELAVGVKPPRAAVAADAAVLEPTERRFVVALQRVDADVAGPQQLGHSHGSAGVTAEHVVVEAVGAVVGDLDRLVLGVEGDDGDDGPE